MNRLGHVGLALLIATGGAALFGLSLFHALWLCAGAAAFSVVSDWDINWRRHRGVTHSLVFMLAVGIAVGVAVLLALSYLLPYLLPHLPFVAGRLQLSSFWAFAAGFFPAACGIGSHLLGDLLTYSGIPLLWPSGRLYSLGVFKSSNMAANVGFGLAGFGAFLAFVFLTG
jgi:inner membrane protein